MKYKNLFSISLLTAYSSLATSGMLLNSNMSDFTDKNGHTCTKWVADMDIILQNGINPFSGRPKYTQNTSEIFEFKPARCVSLIGSTEGGADEIAWYKTSNFYTGKPMSDTQLTTRKSSVADNLLSIQEHEKTLHIDATATSRVFSKTPSADSTATDETAEGETAEDNTEGSLSFGITHATSNYSLHESNHFTKNIRVYQQEALYQVNLADDATLSIELTDANFSSHFKYAIRALLTDINELDDGNYVNTLVSQMYLPTQHSKKLNERVYNFIDKYGSYIIDNSKIGWTKEQNYYFKSSEENSRIESSISNAISAGAALKGSSVSSTADLSSKFVDTKGSTVTFESEDIHCIGTINCSDSNESTGATRSPIKYTTKPIWELPLENILLENNGSTMVGKEEAQKLKDVIWAYTIKGMSQAEKTQRLCGDGGIISHGRAALDTDNLPVWECNYAAKYTASNHADDRVVNTGTGLSTPGSIIGSETQRCSDNRYMKGLISKHYRIDKGDQDVFSFVLNCSSTGVDDSILESHSFENSAFSGSNKTHKDTQDEKCEGTGNFVVGLRADRNHNGGADEEAYVFRTYCAINDLPLNSVDESMPESSRQWDRTDKGEIISCISKDAHKATDAVTGITFTAYRKGRGDEDSLSFSLECSPVKLTSDQ